ncbi:MinD/ParA family protein [Ponticaulis profundi]|uniref:MinD/ParA family protein n=1 Tax=Ponticaulis profundi TaxID=2665222 RepID=A0ABW1SAK2_9PROT
MAIGFGRIKNVLASKPRVQPASVIAVASGKGGVGKSFLSTAIAGALAKAGRRTLLVDGDLGLANVDVHLGIAPQTDLVAVMAGWVELEDAVTPVSGGVANGGFDVLPGRSGSGALAELPSEEVARLAAGLSALSLQYDHVLLDLAAGIESNVMRLARAADRALVVVTDDPASMTDAYAFIKVLKGYAPSVQPIVLINQADNRQRGRQTYEAIAKACQTFLGFRPPLAGIVTRDAKVRECLRSQTPIMEKFPTTQAALDASQVAESLIRGWEVPVSSEERAAF